MPVLRNQKHELFAQGLAKGMTADAAYVAAGYKENRKNASRLKANERVAARVDEILGSAARRVEVSASRVIEELAKIAFADPRNVMQWGPGGVKLKPSADLSDDDAAIVAEVMETTTEAGGSLRVKTVSKLGALELLGKSLGMFIDRKEIRTGDLPEMTPDELRQFREAIAAERARRLGQTGGGGA